MMNIIILMGRLTSDPELRHTPNGSEVAAFTLAVERDKLDSNGNRQCDFIDCVAWQKTAVFLNKHFRKGQKMLVKGSLLTRKWTDKNGNNRLAHEVRVDSVNFADGGKCSCRLMSLDNHIH